MTRAEFLKAMGGVVGGMVLWSSHSEHGSDTVSKEIQGRLDIEAIKIQGRFFVANNPVGTNGEKFIWNFVALSKAVCYLAYLDGGFDEVDRVTNFLKEHSVKLEISSMQPGFAGMYSPALTENPQSLLQISPLLVDAYAQGKATTADGKILHEIYHLVQDSNNHDLMKKMIYGRSVGVLALGILGGYATAQKVTRAILDSGNISDRDRSRERGRRMVLAGIGGIGAGLVSTRLTIGLASFVDAILDPMEVGPYVKIGLPTENPDNVVRGTLTSNPLMQSLEGKLLIRNTK